MRKLSLFILVLLGTLQGRSQVIINELMQSNIDCIMDDLNQFPDSWVELYNAGTTSVNLSQYRLGKENDAATAWQLPNVTLASHGYYVVYCDKEATGRHTDYRLESGKGCAVYLYQGTTLIDKVEGLKKQPAPNIAYGRTADAATTWGYELMPTPGSANNGGTTSNILGEPVFSRKGCVLKQGQSLQLTLSLPNGAPAGTVIRYTIDGSEPKANSTLYQQGSVINIASNRVIRAKLFCANYLSPRSTTHSYIFFPTDRNLTLPVISVVGDDKYFNNSQIGIFYQNSAKAADDRSQNYFQDWRRPINIEYFEGYEVASGINQLCETRVQGGATRTNKLKSLAIYANKRFGTKRFEYEFFPDQRPNVTDFKSLVLRNSGNDFDYLYMRDPIIQRTMASHVDLDWQAWRPAIFYLNGIYKGILNIRERSNEDNVYTHYDGLEDIDMFENWSELKEGTWDNYNAFKAFYAEHNHTLAEYAEWMDWQEFFNLMIMNLYYDNKDFPGNNIVMWRPRAAGGKWRWIAKDTDFGLGLYGQDPNFNTIAWVNDNNYDPYWANWANGWEHTRLFRRMMEDPDLRREFIDRFAIYMGDFLNERGTRAVWDPMYNLIKTEYPYHRKLINEYWPNYSEELTSAQNWLKARTNNVYQHLANYYSLGTPGSLIINNSVNASDLEQVSISVNGITLSAGTFTGKFFQNRQLTLKGTTVGNRRVAGWRIMQVSTGGTITNKDVTGDTYTFTMPVANQLIINAIMADATAIELQTIDEHSTSDSRAWYDLSGRRLPAKPT